VRLVSLQPLVPDEQVNAPPELRLLDVGNNLIITVDCVVAHVSGALGQRTLLALAHGADWRWGTGDRDEWWYSEVRIARQKVAGEWTPVIEALTSQLSECVGRPRDLPKGGQPVRNVLLSTSHGVMLVDRHELARPASVASMLASQGAYEAEEMSLLREIVRYLPRGTVPLDIGADIGAHTLEFTRATSAASGSVISFEAARLPFQMLCGNLAMNSHLNVECHHVALAATSSEASQGSPDGDTRVRRMSLDSFRLPRIDLMQIDPAWKRRSCRARRRRSRAASP